MSVSHRQSLGGDASDKHKWAVPAKRVLNDLMRHHHAWPFAKPVDPLQVPGYYDVIKDAIDLGTIKKRLDANQYEEVDEGTKLRRLALSANTLAALHAHQRMLDTSMLSDLSAPKSQQSSVASLAAAAAALRHARAQPPPAPPPPRSPPSPRTLAAAAAAGHQSGEKKKMDRDPSISQQLQVARTASPLPPPARPRSA